MKRKIFSMLAIVLCTISIFSVIAYAKTYTLSGTDMSINIDDTEWYVFTRDNLKDNPELEELELTYDEMNAFFVENEMYLDAYTSFYESEDYIEMYVIKTDLGVGISNLSTCSDSMALGFAIGYAEELGIENYDLYESKYKYVKLEYTESDQGQDYYICGFVTIVNSDYYAVSFLSTIQFTELEYNAIEDIINSINFEADSSNSGGILSSILGDSLGDNVDSSTDDENILSTVKNSLGEVVRGVLVGIAVSAIIVAFIAIANKQKKKKKSETITNDELPKEENNPVE